MKWAELEPSTRARDSLKWSSSVPSSNNIFSTQAGLAQNFPTRVELELDYNLNEPIPDRQYPLRIGSFTPLTIVFAYLGRDPSYSDAVSH